MRFISIILLCVGLAVTSVNGNVVDMKKAAVVSSDMGGKKIPCLDCSIMGTPMPTRAPTSTSTWCWTTATLTPPPQTGVVVPSEPPRGSAGKPSATPSMMPVFNGASSLQKSLAGLIPGLAVAMALV